MAVNVFLFSLFSYHGQFYMPGSAVTERYNSTIGPLVGPFRGTALALVRLFASPKSGLYGLRSPLKILWAWSIATLAGKFDLPALHNTTAYSLPGFEELEDPGWLSMRISLHIAGSARDMGNHCSGLLVGWWTPLILSGTLPSLGPSSITGLTCYRSFIILPPRGPSAHG